MLTRKIFGKIFADKGYISKKLWTELWDTGLKLITFLKKNEKLIAIFFKKLMFKKRFLIKNVNDKLKNILQLVHSRHRSLANFMVNLVAGLIAYTWQPKKPLCNLFTKNELESIPFILL